jgi:hypothetical protein
MKITERASAIPVAGKEEEQKIRHRHPRRRRPEKGSAVASHTGNLEKPPNPRVLTNPSPAKLRKPTSRDPPTPKLSSASPERKTKSFERRDSDSEETEAPLPPEYLIPRRRSESHRWETQAIRPLTNILNKTIFGMNKF